MREQLTFLCRLVGVAMLFLLAGVVIAQDKKETKVAPDSKAAMPAGDFVFEAHLVWGTTNAISPDKKHEPVSDEMKKVLGDLPLKWNNYFECKNPISFGLNKGESKDVEISKKAHIKVRDLSGKKLEVTLIDPIKKQALIQRTQPLPKGEHFVLAGNAPDGTAWFVILKRIR
jgi:hypothetical protein